MQPPKLVRENRTELRPKERFEQLREELREQRVVQHRIEVKVEVKVEVKTQRMVQLKMQVSTQPAILLPELPDELRRVLRKTQLHFRRKAPVCLREMTAARGLAENGRSATRVGRARGAEGTEGPA